MNIELAVGPGASLGECPVWSVRERLLYWVDIDGRAIHRFDPSTGTDEQRPVPGRPGSVALTADPGRLLVALEHGLGFFDWDRGFDPWIDVEPPGTRNRMNDGRTDPSGRFWVGSMHEQPSAGRRSGALHRIDRGGSVTTVKKGVGVSNALAFSPDGRTMYWADSADEIVWKHDYDAVTGTMGSPRVLADFHDLPGRPDGACVDVDRGVWVACVFGGAVARFSPEGDLDQLIELPVDAPTMPAFGGPGLATMFVTSIGRAESASAPSRSALAGAVLAFEPGVAGMAEVPFAGSDARGESHG